VNAQHKSTCLAIFSGGLDSLLSVKVMQDLGFNVVLLNFDIGFYFDAYTEENSVKKYKEPLPEGFNVNVIDIAEEFYEMIKKPAHGFGKNMNPCIDCKILMLRKAKSLMEKYNAGFVISGEVLGQRPMTQNIRSMKIIEKESGLEGYLLRPLSAKCLAPTEPEKAGWVEREKLLDIQGRSRKRQLALAKELGLEKFIKPPAGGCILTDKIYSNRLRDYLGFNSELRTPNSEFRLLSIGRHFRKDELKFVIGRNEKDNNELLKLSQGAWIFDCKEEPGPITLTMNDINDEEKKFLAGATAGYSKGKDKGQVEVIISKDGKEETIKIKPIQKEEIKKYMI